MGKVSMAMAPDRESVWQPHLLALAQARELRRILSTRDSPVGSWSFVGRVFPASAFAPLRSVLLLAACCLSGCAELPAPSGPIPAAPGLVGTSGAEALAYPKNRGGYPSLAPLLRRVTPAVVNISVVSEVAAREHPFLRDPDFRRFIERFDLPVPNFQRTERHQSVGSGVIVDAARGFVLTNYHLIEDAKEITVTLKDQRTHRARLLGGDPRADVAVLEIRPVDIVTLDFGDSDRLEVGDFVIAIGNPFGLGQTVTSGIVSAVGRTGIAGNHLGDLIQTDASINPGNSGGPLINLAGEVVGISTALIGPAGGNVGIGFAVPSNRARAALNRVLRTR